MLPTLSMSIALSNRGGISTSVGVTTCFHPIYSVRERTIIGLEALSRGYAGISSEEIPPQELFRQAEKAGRLVELDRHCQEAAAESFVTLPDSAREYLLFLNVSAGLIERGSSEVHILNDSLRQAGLSPDQIVLEIVESKVDDIDALSFFVKYHRRKGYLSALDDVGAGHSNLERISLLKPDIIKIDRALKAADCPGLGSRTILELATVYAERSVKRKEQESIPAQNHRGLAERLTARLAHRVPHDFPSVLLNSLRSTRFARCAYIINEDGRQLTATLSRRGSSGKQHRLFAPAAGLTFSASISIPRPQLLNLE